MRYFKSFFYVNWIILIILSLISFRVLATPPDVIGTFSGSLFGDDDDCFTTTTNNVNVNIIITSQNGNSISGTTTDLDDPTTAQVSGTIDNLGNMSLTLTPGGNVAGGTITATFSGNTLTFGINGYVFTKVDNDKCRSLDSGSLTFTPGGNELINPETAAPTVIEDASNLQSKTNTIENPVHLRVKNRQNENRAGNQPTPDAGGPKVSRIDENGFTMEALGGLNAGDFQFGNLGVWLSYNYTETENDFFRTAFESDRHTIVGGIDITPNDYLIAGLAISFESSDTETAFNGGNLESDGFTIAPYFGILLSDTWSLDASMGFSFIENDQFRTDPTTSARVSSDPDTDRLYFSFNLNGISYIDNWILGGRAGVLIAHSRTDDFIESDGTAIGERDTKLGQFRVGGDAGYSYGNWEPFVSAMYEYDFKMDEIELTTGPQPENDRDDILFAAGLRYFGNNGLSSNFEYSKRLLREDFDEDSWTFTVRYDF